MSPGATEVAEVVSAPTEPIALGRLLRLAWPIIVSRSTQTIIGLSDALLVADLGSAAVAAVGTGAFNTFAVLILPMGTLFIVSSFVAQLFGKQDLEGARRYGFYGLVVAGLTQVVCMGVALIVPLA